MLFYSLNQNQNVPHAVEHQSREKIQKRGTPFKLNTPPLDIILALYELEDLGKIRFEGITIANRMGSRLHDRLFTLLSYFDKETLALNFGYLCSQPQTAFNFSLNQSDLGQETYLERLLSPGGVEYVQIVTTPGNPSINISCFGGFSMKYEYHDNDGAPNMAMSYFAPTGPNLARVGSLEYSVGSESINEHEGIDRSLHISQL